MEKRWRGENNIPPWSCNVLGLRGSHRGRQGRLAKVKRGGSLFRLLEATFPRHTGDRPTVWRTPRGRLCQFNGRLGAVIRASWSSWLARPLWHAFIRKSAFRKSAFTRKLERSSQTNVISTRQGPSHRYIKRHLHIKRTEMHGYTLCQAPFHRPGVVATSTSKPGSDTVPWMRMLLAEPRGQYPTAWNSHGWLRECG